MTLPVRTLLLIDDSDLDREKHKNWLLADSTYAYRILEADCVAIGLELCQSEAIDAILLDYSLPDDDGLIFLEMLAAQSGEDAPPVVMTTGIGDETIAVRAIKLGAEDYLVKNRLTPELLQLTVESAIDTDLLRRQLRQAEETAWQQMAQIEAIYTTAPIGLCCVDTELRFIRINERLAAINGLPVSEHIGRTLREIVPDMADDLEPLYQQVIESGEPLLDLEVRGTNRARPGVERQWLVSYYPQKDSHQQVIGVNVVVQEISEVRQAEIALQQQTELLQLIVESVGDGLILANLQGEFMLFNQAAERLFGRLTNDRSCEEWARTYGLFLPDQKTLFPNSELPLYQAMQGISVTDVEVFVRRDPDLEGRWVSISGFPVRGENQEITGGVITCRDITDRKRVEETLRQSEERYRYLSGLIPQHVWIADSNGVMIDVNDRWSEYTGLTLEQAKIQGWQAIVHPEDIPILSQAWEDAQMGGKSYQAEGRVRRADGVYEWHLHQAMPLIDEQGQIIKWFGTATNIHDLKQIEADRLRLLTEAQSARAEAEVANQSKDEFVAMVAHELRSPLNSIAGWAKLLQSRQFDQATQTRALETIWRNTQTQVQLVEDLLDISRMVKGNLHLSLAPVDLVTVIEAAVDLALPQTQAKQIQLRSELMPTPQILGDANRLQQVVVNLLTNSIKFTPEQGQIYIQLSSVETQAQIRIQDTGKGIAPEFLPEIFDQFKQGQKNTGSKDGLGLGLAIVKNLVELHQGTVMAESQGVGQGATFTVQLPLMERSTVLPTAVSADGEEVSLVGIRILVVDDEPDMLNLITFVLEEAGAEVQSAESCAAALRCLTQFTPNILISDISMPGGSGYDLVQQIRTDLALEIPAIALTAYASATYEERSLQAGFQQHLTKPVESEDLIEAIVGLVRSFRAVGELR
jgi:PAS domain S-box-containing protein